MELSDWILSAIADVDKSLGLCVWQPSYWCRRGRGVCLICLAGGVIYQRTGGVFDDPEMMPSDYPDQSQLLSLESVLQGNIDEAFCEFYGYEGNGLPKIESIGHGLTWPSTKEQLMITVSVLKQYGI